MKYEIKICGLTRREDAEAAAEAGADYLGFVLVEKSPRFIRPERIAEITRGIRVKKVGVFADVSAEEIFSAAECAGLDIVQLHGRETPAFARSLHGLTVWKAAHLTRPEDVDFYAAYPAERIVADAAHGGSGECSSWELAAALAKQKAVMLAGGITPENAAQALREVNPAGLDLASGVEIRPGIKSKEKIMCLFQTVKGVQL